MLILFLRRLLWMAGIVAAQVLLFDHINVGGVATVTIAPWAIIMFPQGTGRMAALLWGFCTGIVLDMFACTSGLSAAALTLAAFIQPPLLSMATPKDAVEGFTPSAATLGFWTYVRFTLVVLLAHHVLYFALEAFTMSQIIDSLTRMGASLGLSLLLIVCLDRLMNQRHN